MKVGLVLEGGANRVYFSCGIMDGLLEENIITDYVIGTSAGIGDGISYASGQIKRNYEIATKYAHDKRYMGFKHMLNRNNRSLYNMDFVFDEIPNKLVPFDYQRFRSFKGKCVAVVTNIETGKVEYIEVTGDDPTWQVLRASCALPMLFPPIEIDGTKYLDGGICMAVPLEEAINQGCDKNIVILTRERGYKKGPEKALNVAARRYRKYPYFSKALEERHLRYNENLRYVEEQEALGKAFVFAPESTEGFKRTESDSKTLDKIYQKGYNLFLKQLPKLREYLQE